MREGMRWVAFFFNYNKWFTVTMKRLLKRCQYFPPLPSAPLIKQIMRFLQSQARGDLNQRAFPPQVEHKHSRSLPHHNHTINNTYRQEIYIYTRDG